MARSRRDVQSDARLEERERNGGVMQGRMGRTGREFSFLCAFVCLACCFLSSCRLTRALQKTKSHCSLTKQDRREAHKTFLTNETFLTTKLF